MKLLIPLAFITTLAGAAPFTSDLDSLKQYRCPDWFRDAKFGIWAHWGPQAVPMDGDWYARGMYEPGNGHYRHHLETYGHPSVHGYKDIIPLWKAEKWDPERLMDLYQKAGAKYFVSMGSHHDNFSLWNDKFHRWNAVEMGPKRDIVGEWRAAALKRGLKFGVSEHLAASYTWFQTSHGADTKGDKAGIPYDGADPAYADLYHPPATPGDTGWYSTNEVWHAEWSRRITGLLTDYQPDLLYSDGGLPFGITGRRLLAEYYNRGTPAGADGPQVVYTCKSLHGNFENNQFVKEFCVPDVERGGMAGIQEEPWQTDTSIGDWYCNRNWKPRGADWVVRALADIVSKNGNLLLNVELRPDGSLAPDVEKTLVDLAGWMTVNGEAIFGTRPWKLYGEGPTRLKAGHFNDSFAFKARDIRFTTRGAALYAIALGWPEEGKLTIRSLAKPNDVTSVKLLGHAAPLVWTQTDKGLEIVLPKEKISGIAITFEIQGRQLAPVAWVDAIRPGGDGVITLTPDASGLTTEVMEGRMNIGWWHDRGDAAEWTVDFPKPGVYRVSTTCAAGDGPSRLAFEAAGRSLSADAATTRDWHDYQPVEFGTVTIGKPGVQTVRMLYREDKAWKPVNLRDVILTPQESR